jgi:hypothetical protein
MITQSILNKTICRIQLYSLDSASHLLWATFPHLNKSENELMK